MKFIPTPAFLIACALVVGIAMHDFIPVGIGFSSAALLLVGALDLLARRGLFKLPTNAFWAICLLAFSLMGAAMANYQAILPANHISFSEAKTVTISGIAQSQSESKGSYQRLIVACDGEFEGKILLSAPASMPVISAYDRLEATISVSGTAHFAPGYARYLKSQGIHSFGKVRSWKVVEAGSGFMKSLDNFRAGLISSLQANMTDTAMAGLATAMFIGDRSDLDRGIRDSFSVTGLSHVLSISGMHVTLLFIFLNYILRFMDRSLWMSRLRTVLILLVLVFYMALAGFSPAVCRAVFMVSLVSLTEMFFLNKNNLNVLSIAAIFFLLIDPLMLFDLGFQLSYLAVFGLLVISPKLEGYLAKRFPNTPRAIISSVALTLSAQLVTTPLVLIHFGQFPTYFLLSNLVLIPLVNVSTYLGIAAIFACWIPGLGEVIGWFLDMSLWALVKLTDLIAALPGAVTTEFSLSNTGFLILLGTFAGLGILAFRQDIKKLLSAKALNAQAMS